MLRKLLAITVVAMLATQAGCYNTYTVTLGELAKAQEGGSSTAVKVATSEGEPVVITENSRIGVTERSGAYHPISPFNFTLTRGQLIAPDEDLLLPRDAIETGNVKVVSGTKTVLIVAAGVLAVAAGALTVVLTAPEKKAFGQ